MAGGKTSIGVKAVRIALVVLMMTVGASAALWTYMAFKASQPGKDPRNIVIVDSELKNGLDNPVDWDYWLGVNGDIIGWIQIPGTGIDQPIVQAPEWDHQYYLNHDVYGSWNFFGCPYLDAESPHGLESWNAVIVGHNITYPPAIFHDLELYPDRDFASEHLEAYLYTPESAKKLRVIGVRVLPGWEEAKRVQFYGMSDFTQYQREALEKADDLYGELTAPVPMVTLCSCSYFNNPANERTLVYLVEDKN